MTYRDIQRLDDTICRRLQKKGEPFTDFVREIRSMMLRAGYTKEKELNRIYENLLPELQIFISSYEFSNLSQLTRLVKDYEDSRDHITQVVSALMPRRLIGMPLFHGSSTAQNQSVAALRCEDGQIVTRVTINNWELDATIDTGATSSLIREGFARQLATPNDLRSISNKIYLADGSIMEATQAYHVGIRLGQLETTLSLMILPKIWDNIVLGMDFLCSIGATLSFGQLQLSLNSNMLAQSPTATNAIQQATVKDDGWIEAPATWTVHVENGKIPPELIARVEDHCINTFPRVGSFFEEIKGRHFLVTINMQKQVTVFLKSLEWSKKYKNKKINH